MFIKDFLIRAVLLLICLVVSGLAALGAVISLFKYPLASWKSLLAYDQLANTNLPTLLNFIFGVKKGDPCFGHEDETVSSVVGKLYNAGAGNGLVAFIRNALEAVDPGHCDSAIEREVEYVKSL